MRWPWKKEYDYGDDYEPTGKSRRPRETLKETAEKLIQRRMKKDPDGYGIKAAERIRGIAAPEAVSLKDQLQELQELRGILRELGGGEQQGGLVSVLTGLFNSDLGQQIGGMLAGAANRPQLEQGTPRAQMLQPPLPPMPEPPENTVHLGDLLALIEMEPQEAVSNLDPAWINTLAKLTYPQITSQLMEFIDDPTYGVLVKELLNEERKPWLQEVLRLCQMAASGV